MNRPRSLADLFLSFTALALQGFGGVMVVAQRVFVEDKRWLTREEFLELFAVCQVIPGPNMCNLAVILGDRYFGARGAVTALAGLVLVPLLLVLALAAAYARVADHPAIAGALRGMATVSAGLIAGTAAKLAAPLRRSALGVPACVAVGLAAFVLVALLRLPLAATLFGVGLASCALGWARTRGAA